MQYRHLVYNYEQSLITNHCTKEKQEFTIITTLRVKTGLGSD